MRRRELRRLLDQTTLERDQLRAFVVELGSSYCQPWEWLNPSVEIHIYAARQAVKQMATDRGEYRRTLAALLDEKRRNR